MKETWKEFPLGYKSQFRYAISNHGRLTSFVDNILDGRILKGGEVDGYKIFRYKIYKNGKIINKHLFFHHLVATLFLPDRQEDKRFSVHLDFNKQNNRADNLKWMTQEELVEHHRKNPKVIQGRQKTIEYHRKSNGHKLTTTQVIFLKRKLLDPNRKTRLRILSKRFGVSEMALYRIKTGENWGHIKV
ncbi:MAG: HNH endonuclease [Bacteroidales bacterium]|nr:HNH endonuclease [Bacteroidales bacterium]